MRHLLIALAACLIAGSAHAASIDCKKARSVEEKLICEDAVLSRLDEQVAAAYAAQLKAWGGAIAPYVRDDQRAWVSLRKVTPPGGADGGPESPMCTTGPEARQCLRDTHNHRLGVLTSGGYRLSGVYERGNDFLRIIPWADGLDLAFNAGQVSGYGFEDKHTAVPPGAATVIFPIEDDMTCSLTVSFTAEAAVVKQDGQCGGADLRGRWTRNLNRQPAAELF